VIVSKSANQISNNIKEELHQKLSEFASSNDNLEEIFENREQIEISKHYERMPKPSLVAIQEFLEDKVYYRNPSKEQL
jgi:BioD-like phosphotransacetylase family protein